jgi:IclR family acetate operon transcriptional repressor
MPFARQQVGRASGKGESGSTAATYSVRAVERTLDILDVLACSSEGLSLAGLAKAVGMPKSSVFRYIAALEARRYVTRDVRSGYYRLGLAPFSFHTPPVQALGAKARPWLERLRDEFGETINFGVLDGRRVIYVEVVESPRAMRLSARPGDHEFIHSSALGKAIAAGMDEASVREILEIEGLPRLTSRTITEVDEYMRVLERVRESGYATDCGEAEEGACCIGVGIPLDDVPLRAAISLSSPATRFPRADEMTNVVVRLQVATAEIAASLAAGI